MTAPARPGPPPNPDTAPFWEALAQVFDRRNSEVASWVVAVRCLEDLKTPERRIVEAILVDQVIRTVG